MEYISRCGIHCEECEYKEEVNCPTCHAAKGKMFWGECELAQCSIDKELNNCGECDEFACGTLHAFSHDKEQGDNGKRIENLRLRNN